MENNCKSCGLDPGKTGRVFIEDDQSGFTICESCIEQYGQALAKIKEMHQEQNPKEKVFKIPSAREIYSFLSENIISQEDAKKTLSIAVSQHYRRLKDPSISKSNVLIYGPTGTGKTEIVRCLSRILDVPFIIVDSTNFTSKGFVGEDIDGIFQRLLVQCGGDINLAQKGIVFLDEVDKLAQRGTGDSGVNTIAVQQELLRAMEGTDVKIPLPSNLQNYEGHSVNLKTDHILFICSGAFVGLEKNSKEKNIGVDQNLSSKKDKALDSKKFIKYGLIPEFLGRLPLITNTEALGKDDLISILKNSKKSLIKENKKLFSTDKNVLTFTNNFFSKTADSAITQKLGARGLKQIVDEKLKDLHFELGSIKNKKIKVDWDSISIQNKTSTKSLNGNKKP